jgi:hypothetical protein
MNPYVFLCRPGRHVWLAPDAPSRDVSALCQEYGVVLSRICIKCIQRRMGLRATEVGDGIQMAPVACHDLGLPQERRSPPSPAERVPMGAPARGGAG